MKVQVEDRLTRIRTTVGKKPITAGSGPEFFRKLRGQRRDSRGGFLDFWCQIIEPFTVLCSENQQDNEIVNWLKSNSCEFALAFMYRTQSNDVKELLANNQYDVICFFTPSGIKSLFDNLPKYQQNGTVIGAFGGNTSKAAEEAGLTLDIKAPQPQAQSMVAALDKFLSEIGKSK